MFRPLLLAFGWALLSGCSDPCVALERRVCEELGEKDCKTWRDRGGPAELAQMTENDPGVCRCAQRVPMVLMAATFAARTTMDPENPNSEQFARVAVPARRGTVQPWLRSCETMEQNGMK